MTGSDLAGAAMGAVGGGIAVRVGAAAAGLALIGLLFVGVLTGGSSAGATNCVPVGAGAKAVIPTTEAESLAAVADQVAAEMNMPGRAVLIILMTGWQESSMTNLAGGDRDSVGWLQQRPSQGWGTVDEIMDPAYAARSFYTHLRTIPGWVDMDPGDAAQAVQRSAYPDAYDKWQSAAESLAVTVGADLMRPGDAYGTGQIITTSVLSGGMTMVCFSDTLASGIGGDELPGEAATICPDPTTGRGCITPRTLAFVDALNGSGLTVPSLSCWDEHAWNPSSDHSRGRACDVAVSSGFPDATETAEGSAVASWAVTNAAELGVHYVIWSGQIWYSETGWTTYDGAAGLYDVTTPSGGHYDHVHISVY